MANWDRGTVLIWGACALLVLGLGGRWLISQGGGAASRSTYSGTSSPGVYSGSSKGTAAAAAAPSGVAAEGGLMIVQVSGAVRRPGVYRLRPGARAYEAVRAAGGALGSADRGAVNLAARAGAGAEIRIPRRGERPAAADAAAGVGESSGAPVSLATATVAQLDALDGIGPALADRIIKWRAANGGFKSVDDLDKVSGIGPAKLASLRSQVVP